ncbi:hypothetical protein [Nocardia heshunensis]
MGTDPTTDRSPPSFQAIVGYHIRTYALITDELTDVRVGFTLAGALDPVNLTRLSELRNS